MSMGFVLVIIFMACVVPSLLVHQRKMAELNLKSSVDRSLSHGDDGMREAVELLEGRVVRLEEELDFYRKLLEDPERRSSLKSGGDSDS